MDWITVGLGLALVYVVGLAVSGRSLAREVRRAADAKQPPPRIVGWWERIARAAPWLAALGALLLAAGIWFVWLWVGVVGVCLLAYAGQGLWLRRAARRALRQS